MIASSALLSSEWQRSALLEEAARRQPKPQLQRGGRRRGSTCASAPSSSSWFLDAHEPRGRCSLQLAMDHVYILPVVGLASFAKQCNAMQCNVQRSTCWQVPTVKLMDMSIDKKIAAGAFGTLAGAGRTCHSCPGHGSDLGLT